MLDVNTMQLSNYINQCMKVTFEFSIVLVTAILICSLVLWLIGIYIKSERAIKMGIKISISFLILEMLLIGTILIIAKF